MPTFAAKPTSSDHLAQQRGSGEARLFEALEEHISNVQRGVEPNNEPEQRVRLEYFSRGAISDRYAPGEKGKTMLLINDDHLRRADVRSLDELCSSCHKPLKEYPLLLSDEAEPSIYHAACALQLVTEILVDLFTFFCPPAPLIGSLCSPLSHLSLPLNQEAVMQSTDLEEIKAAWWDQASYPCTRVRWGVAQVMSIKRSKGKLLALLRGRNRWYPVESVTIERPRLCPTGGCDLEEATGRK